MGKSSIHGPFSIALFDNRRVWWLLQFVIRDFSGLLSFTVADVFYWLGFLIVSMYGGHLVPLCLCLSFLLVSSGVMRSNLGGATASLEDGEEND